MEDTRDGTNTILILNIFLYTPSSTPSNRDIKYHPGVSEFISTTCVKLKRLPPSLSDKGSDIFLKYHSGIRTGSLFMLPKPVLFFSYT